MTRPQPSQPCALCGRIHHANRLRTWNRKRVAKLSRSLARSYKQGIVNLPMNIKR